MCKSFSLVPCRLLSSLSWLSASISNMAPDGLCIHCELKPVLPDDSVGTIRFEDRNIEVFLFSGSKHSTGVGAHNLLEAKE